MSYRPADWHILDLDQDPTPGDPQRVKKLAGTLHDFADDVAQVLRDIKGMAKEDAVLAWAGKTADVFTAEFEDAPGKLKKLKRSYELAGDALTSYWPDLEDAQAKADQALRDGRAARDELSTATTALTGANDWVRTATAKADSYDPAKNPGKDVPAPDETEVRQATRNATRAQEQQATAQRNVDNAQNALDAAKRLAAQAKGLREEAARRTVRKLEEASDAGIPNRRWWEEVGDWVSDHWDEIVTVCKWVVAIVGIIVMIVGGPLGWLVFAAALVVLADTIRKMANGTAGWGDLLWAALDCIPATKGLTSLAKLGTLWKAGGLAALGAGALKGIGGGLKNMANMARGMRDGLKGMRTAFRSLDGALGWGDSKFLGGSEFLANRWMDVRSTVHRLRGGEFTSEGDLILGRWNAANGPGPLGDMGWNPDHGLQMVDSFRSGSYTEVMSTTNHEMYRAVSDGRALDGDYWARVEPAGPLQTQLDLALKPEWSMAPGGHVTAPQATHYVAADIPAGSRFFEGPAAPQFSTGISEGGGVSIPGSVMGGANQVLFPKTGIDPDWLVPGVARLGAGP
ncbi:putative T7SS-secreted protein [Streptomyces sp. 2A115]|uniref:putative T7SS-secreted protein n=1 Tax=Streptomyces sp. 2A115 TaxID=3457439 RepID=UPI003FD2F2E0